MLGLTKRQKQVLDFITKQIAETGVSPSYQEICDGIGIKSKSGVHRLVHGLIERGALKAPASAGWYMKARTLAPVGVSDDLVGIVRELCRRSAASRRTVSVQAVRAALGRAA